MVYKIHMQMQTPMYKFEAVHARVSLLTKFSINSAVMALKEQRTYIKIRTLLYAFEQTMIGSSPQCYIPSFMTIGLLVLEIYEGFLPYMGMAAILSDLDPTNKLVFPTSHGCSTRNLISISPVVSEKMSKNVDR